jgi:hypothetical protein
MSGNGHDLRDVPLITALLLMSLMVWHIMAASRASSPVVLGAWAAAASHAFNSCCLFMLSTRTHGCWLTLEPMKAHVFPSGCC